MKIKSKTNRNLFEEIRVHKFAYTILIIFLTVVVAVFTWAGFDLSWQRLAILGLGGGYFIWGILTHLNSDHLTSRIVFEYAAISILASVCLIALII